MSGAPDGAPAAPATPVPAALRNAITVSDPSKPERSGVAVTVWLVSVPVAFALQISDVPAWVLLRLTSVHVSPAPVTVALCPPAPFGPSIATNASTASPAVGVVA